jgi:hypothetical protein
MDRSLEEQSINIFIPIRRDPAYSETRRPGCSKSETVCSSNPFRHSSLALSYAGQIEGKLLSLRRGKNGVSVARERTLQHFFPPLCVMLLRSAPDTQAIFKSSTLPTPSGTATLTLRVPANSVAPPVSTILTIALPVVSRFSIASL